MLKSILTLLILAGSCIASSLTFTTPNQVASANALVTFEATFSNPSGGTVFLNSDSFSVDSPLTITDLFFANSPVSVDSPGTSTFNLFSITLPSIIAPGQYFGAFTILGGPSVEDANSIGTATFSITVPTPTSGVPEPSTLLVALPLLGLFLRKR